MTLHQKRPARATFALAAAVALALLAAPRAAGAQQAVPLTKEGHHHFVVANDEFRTFNVIVPAHSATLRHQHDLDYMWVGIGAAEFVHVVEGKPDAKVVAADGSVHFTRGGFAHAARVDGAVPFHNVTVELLKPQTNPRNLCDEVVAGGPTDCPGATRDAAEVFTGAKVRPAFETDQMKVSLLTIDPNAAAVISALPHRGTLITADPVDGNAHWACQGSATVTVHAKPGELIAIPPGHQCTLHNAGTAPIRFLAVEDQR